MKHLLPGLSLAVGASLLAGCGGGGEIPWTLVGVYDASSVLGLTFDPEAEPAPGYVWVPAPAMKESCGPPKAPDGLGIFEAEVLMNKMSPTLAIVLERADDGPKDGLRTSDVLVAMGDGKPEYLMRPAVDPRYLSIWIRDQGPIRDQQLVRTQLQMELCMEHKTGRAWLGSTSSNLRQAFLLDPPDGDRVDRKYFGGQREPVSGLLGPPDACIHRTEGLDTPQAIGGQGEASLDLIPSDVWGSSLRWCTVDETGGGPVVGVAPRIPLRISETGDLPQPPIRPTWTDVVVELSPAIEDEDVKVTMTYDGAELLASTPLMSQTGGVDGQPKGEPGLLDLLANVPYRYPTIGTAKDQNRYTVLLVPNWQISEGIRRVLRNTPDESMPTAGTGIQDGVGWILEHPEYLYVQVPVPGEEGEGDGTMADWLNLTSAIAGGPLGLQEWGYTVGTAQGRKPIVLPGGEVPTWPQLIAAQRAYQQSLFLGAAAVLSIIIFVGLRRVGDLWSPVPEERADFWPGKGNELEQGSAGAPATPGAAP